MSDKTAILMLAAGASRRLGRPKQLLPYKETVLLKHCVMEALKTPDCDVFVVLGAYYDQVYAEIEDLNAAVIYHQNWEKGMGDSLSYGLQELLKKGDFDRLLLTLGDLPLVDTDHFSTMLKKHEASDRRIIATQYGKMIGVPAVFDSEYFSKLIELKNDAGAKPIIRRHRDDVEVVLSKKPFVDVDTEEAYNELLRQEKEGHF
ncbi:NTP transferase domain-containing protein [Sungkyunkwania multivorans]|uniref:NTP transferase domain-containing protein n=1 Tax=Sungkyunkwania multivorans TaxID=1173618 RepID=A0ABW3D3G0_9FLAO